MNTLRENIKLTSHEDDDGMRWYIRSDKDPSDKSEWMASNTTILDHVVHKKLKSLHINNSAEKQKKVLEDAADFGTIMHRLVEDDLNGKQVVVPDSHKESFEKWLEKKALHCITPAKTEFSVFSERIGVAGTTDGLIMFKAEDEHYARKSVYDLKTGFYSVKAGWQMAGYKLMLEEDYGYDALGMVGIQIPRKGGESKVFTYTHYDWCLNRFIDALGTFKGLYYTKLSKMNWKWLHQEAR